MSSEPVIDGKVESIGPTELLPMTIPVLATICVVGTAVLVAIGATILCCWQRRNKKRKASTISMDFILPSKPTTPSYMETSVQQSASSDVNDDVFNSYQQTALSGTRKSVAGHSRSSSASINFRRSSSMSVFDILPNEVDVDMYSGNESGAEDPRSPSIHGRGKLCFSLAYDKKEETLTVILVRALFLSPRRSKMNADPYVKLLLVPDKKPKYVSKIVRKTLNPIFDEKFVFPCSPSALETKQLKMTVCDYDRFSRQTVIGYVCVQLKDVDFESTPWTGDIWRDIYDGAPCFSFKGQVLVCLSYDPGMGSIRVGILKAKELQHPDTEREIDGIFVKVGMLMNGRLVKTKKTKTQRKSDAPVFNDEFTFLVHPSLMSDVSFSLSVHMRNTFGKSSLLGKTNVGSFLYATGQGLAHWSDMLASSRSSVAQWHVL